MNNQWTLNLGTVPREMETESRKNLIGTSAARPGFKSTGYRVDHRRREAGMTLAEMAICLMLISILSVIAIGVYNGQLEKARLHRCYIDIRSVQTTVWSMSDGITWPQRATFWNYAWSGKKPGPYYYFPNNSDLNRGHGNDMDFCDEENPGNSSRNRDCKDIEFVIICQHNHKHLANYVYIEDEGPPALAGWGGAEDPGYEKFINMTGNNPRPKGPGSK